MNKPSGLQHGLMALAALLTNNPVSSVKIPHNLHLPVAPRNSEGQHLSQAKLRKRCRMRGITVNQHRNKFSRNSR